MTETELMNTTDSRVWASEFCRIVGEKVPAIRAEEDWMLGWFANAIMAGYDEARRRYEKPESARPSDKCPWCGASQPCASVDCPIRPVSLILAVVAAVSVAYLIWSAIT